MTTRQEAIQAMQVKIDAKIHNLARGTHKGSMIRLIAEELDRLGEFLHLLETDATPSLIFVGCKFTKPKFKGLIPYRVVGWAASLHAKDKNINVRNLFNSEDWMQIKNYCFQPLEGKC